MTKLKTFNVLASLIIFTCFLMSCGGGGGSGGSGGSAGVGGSGNLGNILVSQESGSTIHKLERFSNSPITDLSLVDWEPESNFGINTLRFAYYKVESGAITYLDVESDEVEYTIAELRDNDSNVSAIMAGMITDADRAANWNFEIRGAEVSDIPRDTFTYSGEGYSGLVQNGYIYIADFTMQVNFADATGSINFYGSGC